MAGSADIIWLGQIVDNKYTPDTSVTSPKLKRIGDGTEVLGTNLNNGGYKFVNIPNGSYLFYDGTTKKTNILGDTGDGGRNYFDGTLDASGVTTGIFNVDRIPELPQSKITDLVTALAGKVSKTGTTQEISSPLIFTTQRPMRDDGIATGNYSTITDFVCFDDLFDYVGNLTAGIEYFKTVFVIPGKANKAGKQYGTILEAANYLHTQTPAADKRCAIIICNNSPNLPYILAPEGCFQDNYVDWYGVGKKIKVVPYTQNVSKIMLFKNFTMILKASVGARIFQYMDWDDMWVHGYASRTFKGGTMDKTRIIGDVGTSTTFAKDTADVTCQVLDTITNIEPARVNPDTYSPLPDIKVIAGLRLEEDPTLIGS